MRLAAPAAVALVGLAVAVALWQSLLSNERRHLAVLAETQAKGAARELERAMPAFAESLTRIAQRNGAALRQKNRWQIGYTAMRATLWAEASGKVGWVTPLEGTHDLADADLSASEPVRSALAEAGRSGKPALTRSVSLPTGDSEFYLLVPVSEGGRLEGFLVGAFSARRLYSAVVRPDVAAEWALGAFEGERELYRSGSPVGGRWLAESPVRMLGAEHRLRAGPLPETVARLQRRLPAVVLAAGCTIALLFAASVGLAQAARRRAREAEAAHATLRRAQEEAAKARELREERRLAIEASRLKSDFLTSMSHELRTPLNAIMGFAELMHDGKVGPVSAQQKEFLGDILESSRHVLQLVNDVLDLSKVEAGKMEFRPAPVDVGKLAQEVMDTLRTLAEGKRIRIEAEVDPALREVVVDPGRLRQVLYNYLSNALKFTPEKGRVTLRVSAEGLEQFRVEVQDTGIGIAAPDLGRLFTEFAQIRAGQADRSEGTGLGLALTKRIVEGQGGRVGVSSTPGQGSLFYAVLPQGAQAIPASGGTRSVERSSADGR